MLKYIVYNILKFTKFYKKNNNKNNPTAIFIVGQPGAGKTSYYEKNIINKNKYVFFDFDSFSKYNIINNYINRKKTILKGENNKKFSSYLMEELTKRAIKKKYDIVVECTSINNSITLKYIIDNNYDYFIDIRVIFTSYIESLISIFERYIEQRENNNFIRFTTINNHDSKYIKFIDSLKNIEKYVNSIKLYNRKENFKNIIITNKSIYDFLKEYKDKENINLEKYKMRVKVINSYKDKYFKEKELKEELDKFNKYFKYN